MATADQTHWDERYREQSTVPEPAFPDRFAAFADLFQSATAAVEVACGAGAFSVWLAQQGLSVTGYDISPAAIEQATALAARHDVTDRCRFEVRDLDDGLPAVPMVDLVICHMFRDPRLDDSLVERLRCGGTLAVAALSEVGAKPGRFRVAPGELAAAFSGLEILGHEEADGVAWLVATKP